MATDLMRINKFEVCRKFNLSKYICELPKERRLCDGICIKAPRKHLSESIGDDRGEKVSS